MIRGLFYSQGKVSSVQDEGQIRAALKNGQGVLWMDFHDARPEEWILLDEVFHFHPLAIADSMSVQRDPKVNVFDDHIFLVCYALATRNNRPHPLELDLFLGANYVVTIHKEEIPCLKNVQACGQKPFESGSAFLMHSILDALVEDYMPVVERLNTQLDKAETAMLAKTTTGILQEIFGIKKEIIHLRRVIGPMRDAVGRLTREDMPILDAKVRMYFRDTAEQLFRISMFLDAYKDLATSAQELYMSTISNKNNEIIKTLTIITTIILPLTLITGIYGMNFEGMPELHWKYGYHWAMALMFLTVTGSIYYFKRRKWF